MGSRQGSQRDIDLEGSRPELLPGDSRLLYDGLSYLVGSTIYP